MLISNSNLKQDTLKGKTAIVTGAGRGIGYETAKALAWLGANVIIAEIDEKTGKAAEENLNKEFPKQTLFVKTDIGNEKDIDQLAQAVFSRFGKVDIVLNNATVFPMGAVKDVPVEKWDFSYRVNLRGPVLLAKKFLPAMLERKTGVFVCVSSSGAAPFMGAYEVFKTAQVELANTLSGELENSGVYAFAIGPGISKTPGFVEGGGKVAELMGMSLDDLFELNKNAQISPEAAGTGFALAIVYAEKYQGKETSSIQVLREANIPVGNEETTTEKSQNQPAQPVTMAKAENRSKQQLYEAVLKTYVEQSEGWKKRNLFERQWVSRDFKKNTGLSIDEMLSNLKALGEVLRNPQFTGNYVSSLKSLAAYYAHQQDQLKGFEKDPNKLEANLKVIDGWIKDAKELIQALS
jgi:NAD(P)-dependent dehydrogenase (short-subunit alcohol dehydrogenase family)